MSTETGNCTISRFELMNAPFLPDLPEFGISLLLRQKGAPMTGVIMPRLRPGYVLKQWDDAISAHTHFEWRPNIDESDSE